MGNFVKDFTETFDFDDDTITVTLGQLKRIDAMEMLPYAGFMAAAAKLKPGESSKEVNEQGAEFVEIASRIIKNGKYIKNISGMTIGGTPVAVTDGNTMECIYEDFYFVGFISVIAGMLLAHGAISKVDEKKSGKPSTKELKDLGGESLPSTSEA